MDEVKNTLESLLADILRREKNSLEIIQKLQEITVSKNDKVVIEYQLPDGTLQEFEVMSLGYFQQKLTEVNNNLKNITGLGSRSANLKLPDGSIRTIFAAEIPVEPQPIKNLVKPLFFNKKNNKIVDLFMNPLPFISIDLTDKIQTTVNQVSTKKVVLDLDNVDDINYFNASLNGVNITYDDLIIALNERGIVFTEFDEIINITPRLPRYSGLFDVTAVNKRSVQRTVNNVTSNANEIFYKLSTLAYKDLQNNSSEVILKVGNTLVVNETPTRTTKYVIKTVDVSTNEVTLSRVEGFSTITTGSQKLMIDPGFVSNVNIEMRVNVNEYMIIFTKALNPNAGVISTDWGDGIGLYTNELIDINDQNNKTSLVTFYNASIEDVGKALRALAKDNQIPLADAITPSAPDIIIENFKVVQINTHKADNQSTDDLRKKFGDKNQLKSDIEKLDTSIDLQKSVLSTSDFKNDNEKKNAQKSLDDLVSQRTTKVNQFNTTIDDIIARKKDVENFDPKYNIQGFWGIPAPQYKDPINLIGKEEVIGFIYEYRYLRVDGTTSEGESLDFKDVEGKKNKATPSKWVRVQTKLRQRGIDTAGKLQWLEENTNDPDVINSNQLSIPITAGESVEIRVKSVSEAGFPTSPAESEFSESIIIPFPEELKDNVEFITREAEDESLRAKFLKELNSIGLNQHLLDSITIGDTYFAHFANRIGTSFKTPENKPKDVDQILIDHQNKIDQLTALITGEKGKISIAVTDELGTQIQKVNNNDTINVFAGFYRDLTASAPVPKGEIVTKLYYIEIANINPADLELLSYVPGLYDEILPDVLPRVPVAFNGLYPPNAVDADPFTQDYLGFIINKDEYTNYRRFWQTPIGLRSITPNNDFNNHHKKSLDDNVTNPTPTSSTPNIHPFIEVPSFQSSQVKGQLVYSRNHDVTLNNLLYDQDATLANNTLLPIFPGSGTAQTFIWNGTQTLTLPVGSGFESDFCVHTDHPDLQVTSDLMASFNNLFGTNVGFPIKSQDTSSGEVFYPYFSQSKYFNLQSTDTDGLKQLNYIPYFNRSSAATINNFARKFGFTTNDKYLIGKNTVGSYLYLAPTTHKSLHTGSIIFNQGYIIQKGDEFVVRVPIIFQVRMTDYYGAGSSGTGVLGGLGSAALSNLSYAKKIGIDIAIKDQSLFSFDLRVEMQYKPKSVADLKTT